MIFDLCLMSAIKQIKLLSGRKHLIRRKLLGSSVSYVFDGTAVFPHDVGVTILRKTQRLM